MVWSQLLERDGLVFSANFIGHMIRYIGIAGIFFLLLYVWKRHPFRQNKIQSTHAKASGMRREFLQSVVSLAIFSLVGLLVVRMHRWGFSRMYFDLDQYGSLYFWFSVALMILFHDAYFYWSHRAMHHPRIFPVVHSIHHLSHTPTPWAAFSFHPIEALVQALVFPLFILFIPIHPLGALIWLLYMTLLNVLGHCGYELLPRGFASHPITKWHNTTVHHDMHHRYSRCNYGLYFNTWDRIFGTNHSRYESEFERVRGEGLSTKGNPAIAKFDVESPQSAR